MRGQIPEHIVELRIGDLVLDTWRDYTIVHDLLSPADTFDMNFDVSSWDPKIDPEPIIQTIRTAARRFERVTLTIDGALQLTGFIDTVIGREDNSGPSIHVTGRDIGGQVVDVGMPPSFNIVGLTLKEAIERALSPWNIEVVIGNEGNRQVLTYKTKMYTLSSDQATGSDLKKKFKWYKNIQKVEIDNYEATEQSGAGLAFSDTYLTFYKQVIAQRKIAAELKAEPDDTRWNWLQRLLKTQNLLGWFSADGKFVVASPNYDQDPMFHVTNAVETPGVALGSRTPDMNNVEEGTVTEAPGQRYSTVQVMTRQGKKAVKAVEHDLELEAIPVHRPLYKIDPEIKSIEEAQRVAKRLMQEGQIKGDSMTYKLTGFGQGDRLFAFDTTFDVWDDSPARYIHGLYYCTKLTQEYKLDEGPSTMVTLQPKGVIEVPS